MRTHDILELGLGTRAFNCLKSAGIDTIEEVSKLSDEELLSIRHMGLKAVQDVRNRLKIFMETPTYEDLKEENEKLRKLLMGIMTCNSSEGTCEVCALKGANGVYDVYGYCPELIALVEDLRLASYRSK